MSRSEVTTSIEIDAPPAEVWAVVMDPLRLRDWVTIQRKLHEASPGPPRVGATMRQTMVLRGAPFEVRWELEACEAPYHADWAGKGPARSKARTEYRLSGLDGDTRTRFDYRNDFQAPFGPLGAVASRALVGGLPRQEAERSLQRLKALVEG